MRLTRRSLRSFLLLSAAGGTFLFICGLAEKLTTSRLLIVVGMIFPASVPLLRSIGPSYVPRGLHTAAERGARASSQNSVIKRELPRGYQNGVTVLRFDPAARIGMGFLANRRSSHDRQKEPESAHLEVAE